MELGAWKSWDQLTGAVAPGHLHHVVPRTQGFRLPDQLTPKVTHPIPKEPAGPGVWKPRGHQPWDIPYGKAALEPQTLGNPGNSSVELTFRE